MDSLHWGIDAFLLMLITIVGWFLRRDMRHNREDHEKHFKHAGEREIHESALERSLARESIKGQMDAHGLLDNQRFGQLSDRIGEMQGDIKEILKLMALK